MKHDTLKSSESPNESGSLDLSKKPERLGKLKAAMCYIRSWFNKRLWPGLNRNLKWLVFLIFVFVLALVTLGVGKSLGVSDSTAAPLFASMEQDPFARDRWHATDTTWPGTIVFTANDKSVVLTPLGAPEIKGTYSYEIKTQAPNQLEGTLKMTNTIGQVSESRFKLEDGDKLTLTYMTGQRPETYIRLSEEGAEAQKAQLEALLRSGQLKQFEVPPSLR